jgi:catechol 2,3-dioxygenase-like lactoylglutathione lyase family enzyme
MARRMIDHVDIRVADIDASRAFYEAALAPLNAAALANGGTNIGDPGLRPEYGEGYYGAFVLDPDGNKIEAVLDED